MPDPYRWGNKTNLKKLPVIIGSIKSSITREIDKRYDWHGFKWQRSFHDRIIRDENELSRIRDYIRNNPTAARGGVMKIFLDMPFGWKNIIKSQAGLNRATMLHRCDKIERSFNSPEFEGFKKQVGLNRFVLSVKQWFNKC